MKWQKNPSFNGTKNFHVGTKKFAAVLVSNCKGSSGRLELIKKLQEFILVDIFGKCGKPCPKTFTNGTEGTCRDILGSEYKFFLSFENSICKEYITEKFFSMLPYDIIPIVLGGGDYKYFVSYFIF